MLSIIELSRCKKKLIATPTKSFTQKYMNCYSRKYGRVHNVLIKNGKYGFAEFDDYR